MSPTSQPPHPSHLRNICSYTIFSSLLFLFISPVISKPKSKNVSGSPSQIMHVISTLLIFLNISILQKTVRNELYHKIPSDLKVFIWFSEQTAMLFQVNLFQRETDLTNTPGKISRESVNQG